MSTGIGQDPYSTMLTSSRTSEYYSSRMKERSVHDFRTLQACSQFAWSNKCYRGHKTVYSCLFCLLAAFLCSSYIFSLCLSNAKQLKCVHVFYNCTDSLFICYSIVSIKIDYMGRAWSTHERDKNVYKISVREPKGKRPLGRRK
jgi:hypothetical protein